MSKKVGYVSTEVATLHRWVRALPRYLYLLVLVWSAVAAVLALWLTLSGIIGLQLLWLFNLMFLVWFLSSHARYVRRGRGAQAHPERSGSE